MKRADEAVEKVLAGLRGVEAPSGLERRVLAGVRARVAGRPSASLWAGWRWVGVCCAVLMLVGAGVNVWRMERHGAVGSASARGLSARAGRLGVGEVEDRPSQRLKPSCRLRGYGTAVAVPLSGASASAGIRGRYRLERDGVGRDGVSRERESGSAGPQVSVGLEAGFPAPPLPLTAEERLLLRAARHGEPQPPVAVEVAAMPSGEVDETVEFQRFFGKPERIDQTVQKVNQGESK